MRSFITVVCQAALVIGGLFALGLLCFAELVIDGKGMTHE